MIFAQGPVTRTSALARSVIYRLSGRDILIVINRLSAKYMLIVIYRLRVREMLIEIDRLCANHMLSVRDIIIVIKRLRVRNTQPNSLDSLGCRAEYLFWFESDHSLGLLRIIQGLEFI